MQSVTETNTYNILVANVDNIIRNIATFLHELLYVYLIGILLKCLVWTSSYSVSILLSYKIFQLQSLVEVNIRLSGWRTFYLSSFPDDSNKLCGKDKNNCDCMWVATHQQMRRYKVEKFSFLDHCDFSEWALIRNLLYRSH